MKTLKINGSWRILTSIFTIGVHQKTGEHNSKYLTFTTESAEMHDLYIKFAPDMVIDRENGKLDMSIDNVMLRTQVKVSEKTGRKILKLLVYPADESSHKITIKKMENGLGINAEPLRNGHAYAHIATITLFSQNNDLAFLLRKNMKR